MAYFIIVCYIILFYYYAGNLSFSFLYPPSENSTAMYEGVILITFYYYPCDESSMNGTFPQINILGFPFVCKQDTWTFFRIIIKFT